MSDDIVKKLRERTDYSTMLLCDPPRPAPDRLCHDAADEIERLRAENARLADVASAQAQDIVTLGQLAGRAAKLQRTFDLQWRADQRAIKRWQEAHPGNDLVWPDRADMVVWLMDQHAEAERSTLHHIERRDAQRRRAETAEAQVAALREALHRFRCTCGRICREGVHDCDRRRATTALLGETP